MFFKNAYVFRLADRFETDEEALEQAMKQFEKQPIGKWDMEKIGWVPPLGKASDQLVHTVNGAHLVTLSVEEKVIPAAVVNEMLEERIADIKIEQGRNVASKEKKEMKEQLMMELIPQAFSKSNKIYGYIDTMNKLFVVSEATSKKAESIASMLRETLGSFPVVPIAVNRMPAEQMDSWIRGNSTPAEGFELGGDADFEEVDEKGKLKIKSLDLMADSIRNHLDEGMAVDSVSLIYNDSVSFTVNNDFVIKSLKETENFQNEDANDAEDEMARFDAEFVLFGQILGEIVNGLIESFGGEAERQTDDQAFAA